MSDTPPEPKNITISNILHVRTLPPDEERDPQTLYIVPPDVSQRDRILGHFMDAWGGLEQTLLVILEKLLRTDYETAAAIFFNTNGPHQYRELFNVVAETRCTPDDAKKLSTLMERLKRFATKRNRIVHGVWIPRVGIKGDEKGRPIVDTTDWRHTSSTASKEARERISKDDAAQNDLWFSADDIKRIAKDLVALRLDLSEFYRTVQPVAVRTRPEEPTEK